MYIEAATSSGSRMPPQTLPTEDQLAARRQLDEARRALRARKGETRRKIIVGAVVLAQASRDPAFRATLQLLLQQHVTRSIDRELLTDLLAVK
ncbi:MAG: hypothetical protein JO001_08600 [Alphaproteobacteria bacterium]|nr:hypothetical protein [Alphaproteobacteria bacterium]